MEVICPLVWTDKKPCLYKFKDTNSVGIESIIFEGQTYPSFETAQ